jgi:hypothetical protein
MYARVVAGAFVATVGVGSATADQNLNCDAYAAKAVQQQKENQSLGCGFSGGAWSTDYQGHRNWCVGPTVKMANLTKVDNSRTGALAACRQKDAACARYATLAREQNQLGKSCRLSGGAWHDDVLRHRRWCMTATALQADTETAGRNSALAKCTARLKELEHEKIQQRMNQILQMMSSVSKSLRDAQAAMARKIGG